MKPLTYAQARAAILAYLSTLPGWTVKAALKVPQAIAPDGAYTLRFNAQSVYLDAHSLWIDIRVGTPVGFLQDVQRTLAGRGAA